MKNPRRAPLAAWLVVAAVVWPAGATERLVVPPTLPPLAPPAKPPPPSQIPQSKGKSMAGLTLGLRVGSPNVLRGAALRVKLAMKNEGTAEIELPDPRLVSPFEYTLKPAAGQGAVRKLSTQAAIVARYPDARPPPPMFMRLKPGESFETEEDLAQLAVPPIAPGRYLLTAELLDANPKVASGEVAVAVVVPDVRLLAAVDAGADQSLAMAFAHAAGDGGLELFQQDNLPTRPDDGNANLRFASPAGLPLRAVAVAQPLLPDLDPHWYAWLQGDAVGAGLGQGATPMARRDAVPTGLRDARLYERGWQSGAGETAFALIGAGAGGEPQFALARFSVEHPTQVKRFALDPAKRPEQWAVQRQPAAGPASYEVVWVETSGPKSMIMRQTVAPEQPTQPRAQPLLRPDKPILALALAAVGLPGLRMVDAVLRSDDERGQPALQLLSIPLDSGVKPAFWNLAMPPGAGDGSAVRWVVARTATQAPVVMAQVGQRFLIVQPSFDASWRPLTDAAAGATLGRLVAVGNRLWAVWVEPEAGLRYRALP